MMPKVIRDSVEAVDSCPHKWVVRFGKETSVISLNNDAKHKSARLKHTLEKKDRYLMAVTVEAAFFKACGMYAGNVGMAAWQMKAWGCGSAILAKYVPLSKSTIEYRMNHCGVPKDDKEALRKMAPGFLNLDKIEGFSKRAGVHDTYEKARKAPLDRFVDWSR